MRGVRASGSNRFGLLCAATLLAVIHCLPPPICLNSSCCVHGGNMTAADVQRRHEWSHLLCLAACTNSPHIPYLLPRSEDTRRYIYSSWQH